MSMPHPIEASCCAPAAPTLRNVTALADLYRALGDETRLRIMALLRDGEVCVCHLHGSLRLPQPTVSRHLAYLRNAELVAARRQGVWMYYRLAEMPPAIRPVIDSALHALTHSESTSKDVARLKKELAAAP